jgi:hypothetical protein
MGVESLATHPLHRARLSAQPREYATIWLRSDDCVGNLIQYPEVCPRCEAVAKAARAARVLSKPLGEGVRVRR